MTGVIELLKYIAGQNERPTMPPPPPDEEGPGDDDSEDDPLPEPGETDIPWICVIDDFADARELMKVLLNDEGYYVTTRRDGFSAINHLAKAFYARHRKRLRRLVPSVVVLDLEMPVMDGLEFYHQVRVLESRYGRLDERIILVSAFLDRADQISDVDKMSKPVDVQKLLDMVARKVALDRS